MLRYFWTHLIHVTSYERHGLSIHRKSDPLFNSLLWQMTKTILNPHITNPMWGKSTEDPTLVPCTKVHQCGTLFSSKPLWFCKSSSAWLSLYDLLKLSNNFRCGYSYDDPKYVIPGYQVYQYELCISANSKRNMGYGKNMLWIQLIVPLTL